MAEDGPVALGKQYQQHLVQTGEELRERAISFKQLSASTFNDLKAELDAQREQLQPKVQALAENYKATIADVESPVPSNAASFLLKVSPFWCSGTEVQLG